MAKPIHKIYKTRPPRTEEAQPGEPVWGNGCERRGCLHPSYGVFIKCADGVAREFCAMHGSLEAVLSTVSFDAR